jgi:hypothetical protein
MGWRVTIRHGTTKHDNSVIESRSRFSGAGQALFLLAFYGKTFIRFLVLAGSTGPAAGSSTRLGGGRAIQAIVKQLPRIAGSCSGVYRLLLRIAPTARKLWRILRKVG